MGQGRGGPEAVVDRAATVASLLGGLATLAITLLVTFDVLMRYFLNAPQLFVDEVSGFLQVLVVFGGLAYTFRARGHVRVDLLTSSLPPAVRAWLRVLTLAGGAGVLLVMIVVTWQSTLSAYGYGRVSAVMLYPIWLAMALIPAGLALMAAAMLLALLRQLRAALGPRAGRDEVHPSGSAG
jgi:TRAP-type C4-dicarboxylate transport system permease small subunit